MLEQDPVLELMRAATSGVSKTQATTYLKTKYNLDDQEIDQIIKICEFNPTPRKINYRKFYNLSVTQKAERIEYPFTQLYTVENFFSTEECNEIIKNIEARVRPSTVSNPKDEQITSEYRTSSSADFPYYLDPFCLKVDNKISDYMEIDPFLGETLQAQKYKPGQYYKEHNDYFDPRSKEYKTYTEWMGQRTWTFMCYLNTVEEGGETFFKHLKLKIKPQQGMAVIWNNLYKNGIPNYKTLHEACPPISGKKYVITKWFRSWNLV
jgi:prolyl 4-hydroxylase